jgi:hypothetical protein
MPSNGFKIVSHGKLVHAVAKMANSGKNESLAFCQALPTVVLLPRALATHFCLDYIFGRFDPMYFVAKEFYGIDQTSYIPGHVVEEVDSGHHSGDKGSRLGAAGGDAV